MAKVLVLSGVANLIRKGVARLKIVVRIVEQ